MITKQQLFEEFPKSSYDEWVGQLTKDLKGQSESLIQRIDEIEEIEFNTYQHPSSINTSINTALENVYVRNTYSEDNRWENVGTILVND